MQSTIDQGQNQADLLFGLQPSANEKYDPSRSQSGLFVLWTWTLLGFKSPIGITRAQCTEQNHGRNWIPTNAFFLFF